VVLLVWLAVVCLSVVAAACSSNSGASGDGGPDGSLDGSGDTDVDTDGVSMAALVCRSLLSSAVYLGVGWIAKALA
jgi:hypothetical protein